MSSRWRKAWGQVFLVLAIILPLTCKQCWALEKGAQPRQEPRSKKASAGGSVVAQLSPDEPRIEIERLKKAAPKRKKEKVGNAFGATSWYVPPPPPPPVKPPPPPPPTAPPMPFTFLGLYQEEAATVLMLLKGGHVYTVAVGEVIENTYRVDSVQNGVVELTYLPLNIKQSINTGSSL